MAIAIDGTISELTSPDSTSVSLVNGKHTTSANTDIIIACWGLEGNETPEGSNAVLFDIGGTDQEFTLISDTGASGSNSDVRTLVYGLVSPGAVTEADVRFDHQFSANQIIGVMINFSGVVNTSVAAATNDIDTTQNTVAGSTTVLSSGGATGNGLLAWGVAQGNDMAPSSVNNSFTERLDDVTAATTSDFAYNLSTLLAGAPSGVTISWNTTDQNSGNLIELIPSESTNLLPDYTPVGRGVMRGSGRGT